MVLKFLATQLGKHSFHFLDHWLSEKIKKDQYKVVVGKNHKWLREEVLGIRLQEMRQFYGLTKVEDLEAYERGEIELPFSFLKKLTDFFHLKKDLLEDLPQSQAIFSRFDLNLETLTQYLLDGYEPLIACAPSDREDLLCRIIMYKEENGFMRLIASNVEGSFMSNGGGAINIHYLIHAMIKQDYDPWKLSILKVREDEWGALQESSYYSRDLFVGRHTDRDCHKIFNEWYRDSINVLR